MLKVRLNDKATGNTKFDTAQKVIRLLCNSLKLTGYIF